MQRTRWWGIFALVTLLLNYSAYAETVTPELSIATTPDKSIVVALRPYFPKKERKKFWARPPFAERMVPVGVLLQNFSQQRVRIATARANPQASAVFGVLLPTPHSARTVGYQTSPEFFADAQWVNQAVAQQFGHQKVPTLWTNDRLDSQWIAPGESAYGVIFLDARTAKFTATSFDSLDGVMIDLTVLPESAANNLVATLPVLPQVAPAVIVPNAGGDRMSTTNLSLPQQRAVQKALADCHAKAMTKLTVAAPDGQYVVADLWFDRAGNNTSHTVVATSGQKPVTTALDQIVKNMATCSLPDSAKEGARQTGYSHRVLYGDPVRLDRLTLPPILVAPK